MRPILYRTGRMPMLIKISIGFLLGMLFGLIAAPMMPYSTKLTNHVMPFLDLAGKIFLRLLTVIIIPLVFSSLVEGIASIENTRKLGRVAFKTIFLFLLTTIIAAGIGLVSANIFKPGSSISIAETLSRYSSAERPTGEILLDILPSNIASALHINILYVIISAVVIGIICVFTGETGRKISGFFARVSEIMQTVTFVIMWFAPFGVFALIAVAAVDFGLTLIAPFAKIIAAVYSGCILHALIVYSLIVMIFCRRSPRWFFRGIYEAAVTAFATRSSSITLPITMDNVRKNFGVSESISSFVLPLGATLNMDGTAIYQTVCAVFVALAYEIPLTFELQAGIFTATVIASIGTVGVPSAGMIMMTMVLTSAGLPVDGVGLIAGIDVLLGAARTSLNVIGDGAVCVSVAASEGENLTQNNSRGRMPAMNYGA